MLTRRAALVWIVCWLVGCGRAQGVATDQVLNASVEPAQTPVPPDSDVITLRTSDRSWLVKPLAQYRITARVLSRERYFLGWTATLSPIDLALGWGRLSDPDIDDFIDWQQGGRWYYYQWSNGCPLTSEEIHLQSANVHVVPANSNLRRALLQVSRDDVIKLEGFLVSITAGTGDVTEPWQSSLSRTDVGHGACEIMFVESMISHGLEYR